MEIIMNQIFILLLTLFLLIPSATGADIDIRWNNPAKYTDIRAGENNHKQFRKQLFDKFEKHFSKLATQLPEEQTLKIKVTNIDLAGSTLHAGINRIRIIKETYPPRMKFSYQLINVDQSIEIEGDVVLSSMIFMMKRSIKYRNDTLKYEKIMLDKWFAETFKSILDNK